MCGWSHDIGKYNSQFVHGETYGHANALWLHVRLKMWLLYNNSCLIPSVGPGRSRSSRWWHHVTTSNTCCPSLVTPKNQGRHWMSHLDIEAWLQKHSCRLSQNIGSKSCSMTQKIRAGWRNREKMTGTLHAMDKRIDFTNLSIGCTGISMIHTQHIFYGLPGTKGLS